MQRPVLKKIRESKIFRKPRAGIAGILKRFLLLSLANTTILPRRILSISISRGLFSIACGTRSFAGIRISGFRVYPSTGDYPTPDEVARGASSFMDIFRAHKHEVTLSVPKEWAVVKTVDFPRAVSENLHSVVANEMDRLTPFEPDEAYYDFCLEPQSVDADPERLRLLLVAVRSDQLAFYLNALKDRNVRPNRLTVNFFSLGSLFAFREKKSTAVFVDVEEAGYEAALVVNGTVRAGYAGALAGRDGRSRMESVMKGASTLKGMAPADRTPEIVIHAGYPAGSLLEAPDPSATPPFRVAGAGDWGMKIDRHGEKNPAPAAALGGILPGFPAMNLFRRGVPVNRRPPLVLSIVLLIAITLSSLFCLLGPLELERNRQAEIEKLIRQRKAEVSRIEDRRKEADALGRELAILNSYHASGMMALDILKELTATLPANTWLARMRITEATVTMEGYTSGSAAGILASLEKSGTFTHAEFASPTFRDQRMNAERFAIKVDLKNPRFQIPQNKPAGKTS